MSFRTRLIGFFVVIVLLPMVAIGGLFYRLIADSEQGKTDAQATGLASAAGGVYQHALLLDRADAHRLAFDSALLRARGARLRLLMAEAGLKRVVLRQSGRTVVDVGDPTAIAPGVAHVSFPAGRGRPLEISVSSLSARDYMGELETSSDAVVVSQGTRRLAASVDVPSGMRFARRETITLDRVRYREVTISYPGFGATPVSITMLSSYGAGAVGSRQRQALAFVAGLLVLALAFAVLSSRALQAQVRRFLHAARRLGSGDFSDPVDTAGNDEFAALAVEFNRMSQQLDRRLQELTAERARMRESVRRIGQTFAANLDRPALVTLALQTAIDATESDCGRVRVSDASPGGPLAETARHGLAPEAEAGFDAAEHAALSSEELGRDRHGDLEILSVALRSARHGSRAHGLITVARRVRAFTDDEVELLRSLAGQAALALENIDLHLQVSRQAVTDELTGLANHGRFQEMLEVETEQVRRYRHPLGLIMIDLDDFKRINDTYGHPQGDLVLRAVGLVVHENSRETDWPARYGGEELALILPHTDLEGAYVIAERIRIAIEQLRVPRPGGGEPLRITASLGVAASVSADRETLVAQADAALYDAKRAGKNRTVRGGQRAADVVGAE
jgi:diguanylate cyclase (GGDEF)-like protein